MTYIGIDPGSKGAMALMVNGHVTVVPYDKTAYLTHLSAVTSGLRTNAEDDGIVCCIEQVSAHPGEGVKSVFTFGTNYGWLLGVLDTLQIPYQPITPQRWKKEFGLTSDKSKSIEVCKRLFPNVSLLRTERSRKEDDNCAEAVLLMLYAKRKF